MPEQKEHRTLILLSVVIGACVGLVVVAFILLTGRLSARIYPPESATWRKVLVPALGALISGWLLSRYFPEARGSGIPQTKFAIFIYNGYISLKTVLGKLICCSISLSSGIALGREGPSAQIGAGVASLFGRHLGLRETTVRSLLPMGCSAALAAAFNTPIAAVLFSLEEILGDLQAPVIGSIVLSAATSWMVLHLILGDEPLFHVPAYKLVHPGEFGIYAVLGVIGGFASVAFVKLLLQIRLWFRKLPRNTVAIQPAIGGVVVGLLGWQFPQVLGVGYDYVERVLGGDLTLRRVVTLAGLKIIATSLSYSSGNAGGIFGPSLFIGAMLGGAIGSVAHQLFPAITAGAGAYALVGMGAVFAGVIRTPMTSVIMIFEITRDYSIIVPLMIANLISFYISYRLQREPVYEALAHQDGVHLPSGEIREQLSRLHVARVMRPEFKMLDPSMSIAEARAAMEVADLHVFPVGTNGSLWGLLRSGQDGGTVGEVVHFADSFPHLHMDEPLSLALEKMGGSGLDALPVVSRANRREMLGIVTLSDVLKAYGLEKGVES